MRFLFTTSARDGVTYLTGSWCSNTRAFGYSRETARRSR